MRKNYYDGHFSDEKNGLREAKQSNTYEPKQNSNPSPPDPAFWEASCLCPLTICPILPKDSGGKGKTQNPL